MPGSALDRAAGVAWRALVVVAGLAVVVLALARLRLVVLPVIVSALLATVLAPPVAWLARRGLPRLAATWAVLLGVAALAVGLGFLLIPSVADQFRQLGPTLSESRQKVEDWLADGPLDLSAEDVDRYTEEALDQLGGRGNEIVSGVFSGAVLAGEIVAGVLLTFVLTFFFVKDGPRLASFALRQVAEEHHELARALGRRALGSATGYVRGVAVVGLVDAVIIGIGLAVIGVPLVLPLAVLTFVAAFFPLVGATLAGAVAALVALVSGGVTDALLVLAVVVVVQQVEGHVLAPLVLGRAVALHPVVIILVLGGGAVVGGLVGAFLAVPVTAVIVAVAGELKSRGILGPAPPQPERDPAASAP